MKSKDVVVSILAFILIMCLFISLWISLNNQHQLKMAKQGYTYHSHGYVKIKG